MQVETDVSQIQIINDTPELKLYVNVRKALNGSMAELDHCKNATLNTPSSPSTFYF